MITTTIIWNLAEDAPTLFDVPVLAITKNGKMMAFKDTMAFYNGDISTAHSGWKHLAEKYKIIYWTYQAQIMHELGEKSYNTNCITDESIIS